MLNTLPDACNTFMMKQFAPLLLLVIITFDLPKSIWSFTSICHSRFTPAPVPGCLRTSVSSSDDNDLRFAGVGRLYTEEDLVSTKEGEPENNDQVIAGPSSRQGHLNVIDRLRESHCVVVGLGGVGSWAAEALCRSGIGYITLIDLDDICISNTNRQLHALSSSVGQMKIDAMKTRLLQINPNCKVTLIYDFVSKENADEMWDDIEKLSSKPVTACLDAIDGSDSKAAWIASCVRRKVPVVTCGGSAGLTDPTKFICDDLTRAFHDPLLSLTRKNLRKYYGFQGGVPKGSKCRDPSTGKLRKKLPRKWKIQAVYSSEQARSVSKKSSSMRQCDGPLGTACFVTGTSGFIAAGKSICSVAREWVRTKMGHDCWVAVITCSISCHLRGYLVYQGGLTLCSLSYLSSFRLLIIL